MEKRRITGKIWSDFLAAYASCNAENKTCRKIMLGAIMTVLLLNAATICYIAVRGQPQGLEIMEELLQMLLLLILSSGIVGFGMIKSGKQKNSKNKKGTK